MTQNGVVTKLLDRNTAEVAVERGTACGGNCGSCETCMYANRILITAANPICARPGERVVIEGRTASVMGATLLVYILPLILFFAAYALAWALGASQGLCVGMSFAGLAVGALAVVIIGRAKKEISFEITSCQS